jgi:Domain of unknown function (DUF4936)
VTRQLFIYWKTPRVTVAQARSAAEEMQAQLRSARPGLLTRLYLRVDEPGVGATLMETYAVPGAGVDQALQAQIAHTAQALAPWCSNGRHVEVFEELR